MAQLRTNGPYIWMTWLTRLLVGEQSCEWASWFRANHEGWSWAKVPDTFDNTTWQMSHTAQIHAVRARWEDLGYRVYTEGQNAFTLQGRSATLGGKPDLVAVRNGSGVVIDVKSGKDSPSHCAQVMLYQYALPKALQQYRGLTFSGVVDYPDHSIEIPASAISEGFVAQLADLIGRIASMTPARKVPSQWECQYCNITGADCLERMEAGVEVQVSTTDDF